MLNQSSAGTGATVERAAGPPPALAMSERSEAPPVPGPDAESRAWILGLRAEGARREEASRRLHDLLLRAARFEINRRKVSQPHLRGGDLDDLAHQAANDALFAVLGKLETYRGESRFTTCACAGCRVLRRLLRVRPGGSPVWT
jgi:hypothetical protein